LKSLIAIGRNAYAQLDVARTKKVAIKFEMSKGRPELGRKFSIDAIGGYAQLVKSVTKRWKPATNFTNAGEVLWRVSVLRRFFDVINDDNVCRRLC
jgi:hypothetical protein